MLTEGIITKAISGFYYVFAGDNIIECKASGIFRKLGVTPLVGDRAVAELDESNDSFGRIIEIRERKNKLVRPPVANIDNLFIVSASVSPIPNTLLIDEMVSIAENNNIEPIILFNKSDIADVDEYVDIYRKSGFKAIAVSAMTGVGVDKAKALLQGKISAFTGNSGVGKSTIINAMFPQLDLQTGSISKKLGRGRHTTRHVELFHVDADAYILDTPGFSSMDFQRCDLINKDDLPYTFRDFAPYINSCMFTSCSHTKEKGCAVIEAVKQGIIPKSRHNSYISLYEVAKNIKEWELPRKK